jgi:ketosteroid isomerase-like protein
MLLLGLTVSPRTAPGAAGGDVAELVQLESVWNESHLRADADALDRLWADDLVVVVPRMAPLGKSDALAFLRSGRTKFSKYETSEVAIRRYGDTAVATGRLRRSRDIGGRVLEDDWRFAKVYVRQAGAWRVVAFQASDTGP